MTRNSQHGFTKGKCCLTNLIASYDAVPGSVHTGKSVAWLWQSYNIVSHRILASKLQKDGLDKWTVGWIESWLDCPAQRVVINSWISGSQSVPQRSVLGPV